MSDFRKIIEKSITARLEFVPYIEKHKLYEFFYELITQLLIQQPEDPIIFMKQSVQHIIRKRDIPRLILIAPPNFDKMIVAQIIEHEIGICPITLKNLHTLTSSKISRNACLSYDADEIALKMKKILTSGMLHSSGWILVDIPRNKKEARALQNIGIIPTHVIEIILNEDENQRNLITSCPVSCNLSSLTENIKQLDYKRNLQGLREAYANLIIGIEAGCRTIQQLGKDCVALTKIPKHYGAPSLFRIVLIGPPGSGYQTLAKDLSERFNLIHVNFNYILAQACFQETTLEEILFLSEHRCEQIKPEIRVQIAKEFLLRPECLKTGWIMTNFPKTLEDFKFLDMIPTPPNRVIILVVDIETCRRRLICCQQNKDIESEYGLTLSYPENHRNIEQSFCEYQENIRSIMRYVGDSASIINATGDRKLVRERLEACLIRAAPSTRIRIAEQPCPAKKVDTEFDPDDEPDPSILDDIRVAEPKYCFI